MNLEVVASLKPNEKLILDESGYLRPDPYRLLRKVLRMAMGYNRTDTVRKVTEVVAECTEEIRARSAFVACDGAGEAQDFLTKVQILGQSLVGMQHLVNVYGVDRSSLESLRLKQARRTVANCLDTLPHHWAQAVVHRNQNVSSRLSSLFT